MNKLVIFDLDGVLIDSRNLHYNALNIALKNVDEKYTISPEEHLSTFDGLNTTKKLEMLHEQKGLPKDKFNQVWKDKQESTRTFIYHATKNSDVRIIIQRLKKMGWKIAVASNSIRETVRISLHSLNILQDVDYYVSNEDVTHTKPFPEMYWKCMTVLKALPKDTIIVEDSHIGREGALNSGATLYPVKDAFELNEKDFMNMIESLSDMKDIKVPWRDKKMNVVVPMAGAGSRFEQAGYTFPKPLIDVNGKPMIQVVVENLNVDAHFIFLVQKKHYEQYNLKSILNLISPGCDIILVDGLTSGAASTTLLAKELINNDDPVLFANSDQFIEWDANECMYAFSADDIDAGMLTFKSTHPKWSFAKLGDDGLVSEVAEKNPISDNATVGVYFWKKGSDYVRYAEQMIEKDIRVNNEFYICPVFNEAILDKKKIRIKEIKKMWGLGTPEDLDHYMKHHDE